MRSREDPIIDSAIRKALGGRLSSSSANCPDDNALAAYLEQKLSLPERARLEDHASTCVQCQEVLALSMKLDETQRSAVVGARPARTVLLRFSFTLSSLALVVVAVVAAVLLLQMRSSQKPAAIQEIVELRPEQRSLPAAPGKSPTATTSRNGHEVPAESTDVKRRFASAARDEESRAGEKARRDKTAQEKDVPATPAKKSQETLKEREADSPAQKDDARKQVPTAAGQGAVRIQTAAGSEKDGLLQVQSNERKPRVPASAPTNAVVAEMSAKTAQITPQSALDAFSRQFTDQTSAYDLRRSKSAENQKLESAPKAPMSQTVKKVVNKTFYLVAGYWIDEECRGRSAAPVEEVTEGEARYVELSKEFPGIEELRSSRLPVLLHRGDKNYVIRFRTP